MSTPDVQANWPTFAMMLQIYADVASGRIVLDGPDRNVPEPFPATAPSRWARWALGVRHVLQVDQNFQIADKALTNAATLLTDQETIAAAVLVAAVPSASDIKDVIASLNRLNAAIKQDQNFEAIIAFGSALAKAIQTKKDA